MKVFTVLVGLALGVFLLVGCSQSDGLAEGQNSDSLTTAEKKALSKPRYVKVTVPKGTPLRIILNDTLQTNKNQEGDVFTGTLNGPLNLNGRTLIPDGSLFTGVITQLVKGGTLKTSPEIGFIITDFRLPGGKSYSVDTYTIYRKGRSHTAREVAMIGGGAAAGAIIGGIIGDEKGAVIGGAAGAAAGTGASAATGRQNLIYPEGLTLTFQLQEPLTIIVPDKDWTPPISETKKEVSGGQPKTKTPPRYRGGVF